MSTDYRPLSIYRDECGSISLAALAAMLVIVIFSMSLSYFVRGGAENTRDYLRETELELAAKSAVADYEYLVINKDTRLTSLSNNAKIKLAAVDYGTDYPITVTVTAMRHDLPSGTYIYLVACAIEKNPEVSFERREIVKGVWKKNGTSYDYQGYAP